MKKDDCDDIRPLLDAWIDGELSGSDRRRVARHAETCPGCLEEAESRGGIDDALRADDKAGDPGDAYFGGLGDRIGARFDFEEAARHWAKPQNPPRRRRLTIPRAWVPRFAFGIAGAAVVTIAGILVHDLGPHPVRQPVPHGPTEVIESREAPSRAGSVGAPEAPSRKGTGGVPATPVPGSSVEQVAAARKPASARPVPDFAAPSRQKAAEATAQDKEKGSAAEEANGATIRELDAVVSAERQDIAVIPPAPSANELRGAGEPVGSPALRAQKDQRASDAAAVADAETPGRPELLAFFGVLTESRRGRVAAPSTESIAASKSEVPPSAADRTASTRARSGRGDASTPAEPSNLRALSADASRPAASSKLQAGLDEAVAPADSTWISLGRIRARAMADSALATGTLEGCESALRAYWAMLHRDGRPLVSSPAAYAKALEPDRLRIERLLQCASR